ncbi:hypothetical protein L7F22_025079 [Adiantum nelumboides]|nr:hypothetical protein [Adiantum nelumboides]
MPSLEHGEYIRYPASVSKEASAKRKSRPKEEERCERRPRRHGGGGEGGARGVGKAVGEGREEVREGCGRSRAVRQEGMEMKAEEWRGEVQGRLSTSLDPQKVLETPAEEGQTGSSWEPIAVSKAEPAAQAVSLCDVPIRAATQRR